MRTGNPIPSIILVSAVTIFLYSCTPGDFIKPNPPPSLTSKSDSDGVQTDTAAADSMVLDFGTVFDSGYTESETESADRYGEMPAAGIMSDDSTWQVPDKKVRVAILRSVARTTVYSVGSVFLSNNKTPLRGRIAIEQSAGKTSVACSAGTFSVALPCTLQSDNDYNFMEIENATYRGALVVIPDKNGRFTLVNLLDVEEYLRGVLPFELGKQTADELEALKAQAVAARTYTYRRMTERWGEAYDVVNTVSDQVYGGASAEYRESDAAIRATADRILTFQDSIIYAYYHSTCGGMTATIDQVWKKPHQEYLVSVSDLDEQGEPYCSNSKYLNWDEEWQWMSFTAIVMQNLKRMYPGKQFNGPVTNVSVKDRFPCGRIKTLQITGKGWVQDIQGDEIRFILRRAVRGNPILRSANFSIDTHGRSAIHIKGKGYGHGVGLCQTGAVGRARSGQNYRTILNAYYPGTMLVTVVKKEVVGNR